MQLLRWMRRAQAGQRDRRRNYRWVSCQSRLQPAHASLLVRAAAARIAVDQRPPAIHSARCCWCRQRLRLVDFAFSPVFAGSDWDASLREGGICWIGMSTQPLGETRWRELCTRIASCASLEGARSRSFGCEPLQLLRMLLLCSIATSVSRGEAAVAAATAAEGAGERSSSRGSGGVLSFVFQARLASSLAAGASAAGLATDESVRSSRSKHRGFGSSDGSGLLRRALMRLSKVAHANCEAASFASSERGRSLARRRGLRTIPPLS